MTRGAIYLDIDLDKNAGEHNIARLLFLMLPSPRNLLGYPRQSKGRPSFLQFQYAFSWSRLSAGMHGLANPVSNSAVTSLVESAIH